MARVVKRGAVVLDGQLREFSSRGAHSRADGAKSESASSSFKSRGFESLGPMQLISSITPRQVSRNFTGTATIGLRFGFFVFLVDLPKNRVSFAVSGTTTVSPAVPPNRQFPAPP